MQHFPCFIQIPSQFGIYGNFLVYKTYTNANVQRLVLPKGALEKIVLIPFSMSLFLSL